MRDETETRASEKRKRVERVQRKPLLTTDTISEEEQSRRVGKICVGKDSF